MTNNSNEKKNTPPRSVVPEAIWRRFERAIARYERFRLVSKGIIDTRSRPTPLVKRASDGVWVHPNFA